MKRKWGWMGHTWRKPHEDITQHEEEVGLDGPHLEKPQEDITRHEEEVGLDWPRLEEAMHNVPARV
jgi:hypothetical protein